MSQKSEKVGVVVSNGGCQGLFNALSVIVDPGDRIALPNPGWPNYRSMAGLLGASASGYRGLLSTSMIATSPMSGDGVT